MQENKVILTWEAIYDVTDIAEYIESEFGIERADCFQNEIKEQFEILGHSGGMFGKTQIYYAGYCIYKKPFLPSIIFYIIKELEREVHILRVLWDERDWNKILTAQREYTYPQQVTD